MTTQQVFLATVAPTIQRVAFSKGYRYPSAIIAQAILESGWGTTTLARSFNYFGMKCGSKWGGDRVRIKTWEEIGGRKVEIYDDFRAFGSVEQGIAGYFDFIASSRYKNLKTAKSAEDYVQRIKSDGWATDSRYVSKLINIINTYGLKKYDSEETQAERSVDDIAMEVILGRWGNGQERKDRLSAAGYDYKTIQKRVNEILKGK